MKIGDKKNQKQQQIWIMAIVINIVLVFLFFNFVHSNLNAGIQKVDTKLKEVKARLEEANSIADRKEIIEKELAILELKLSSMSKMLPQKKEIPKFLKTIISRANDNSVRVVTFTPTAIISREFYNEVPVAVNIRSSFNNLGLFFTRIGNLDRIVNVENVQLTATPGDSISETISAAFAIKTFTYPEGGGN